MKKTETLDRRFVKHKRGVNGTERKWKYNISFNGGSQNY